MAISQALLALSILTASGSHQCMSTTLPSQFTYLGGMNQMLNAKNSCSYFYYGMDIFSMPFAAYSYGYSDLIVLHTRVDYTPGFMAYFNQSSYPFNANSYLTGGYLHLSFSELENEDCLARSGSIYLKESFPQNNYETAVITCQTGGTYSYTGSFEAGVSFGDDLILKETPELGLELSYADSISVSKSEPAISNQLSAENSMEQQYSFIYAKSENRTFTLDTYTFIEIFDDGRGYTDDAFKVDLNIYMLTTTGSLMTSYSYTLGDLDY